MNGAHSRNFFWRGQKVKYHLISITKSISKIFIPNFVCVLTNKSYKTYQTGFLFCHLGHALGVGHGGASGPKSNSVLLSVRYAISACTNFLKQEVVTSTLWFGSHRPYLLKSNYVCAVQCQKCYSFFFKHDVVCNAIVSCTQVFCVFFFKHVYVQLC